MHIVLTPDKLGRSDAYPEWCGLGWFRNYRQVRGNVEPHYHDLPEVYLWHEGEAEAVIDVRPVSMRPGVVSYTAAGAHHSYVAQGLHSNTGLMPKSFPGCRGGHLHTKETGETPNPKLPSFCVMPEVNPFGIPQELPRHCFARHITSGRFSSGQILSQRITESWIALLVRESKIDVRVDGQDVEVLEGHLFVASKGVELSVSAVDGAEVAMAEGWPV